MKGCNHPKNKVRICHKTYCPLLEWRKDKKFKLDLRCSYEY